MLRAKNQDQALDLLYNQSGADMVICDRAPINKKDGLFLKAIQEKPETHFVYIILMRTPGSITGGDQNACELIDDVMEKSMADDHLQVRIAVMKKELNRKYLHLKCYYHQTVQLLAQKTYPIGR